MTIHSVIIRVLDRQNIGCRYGKVCNIGNRYFLKLYRYSYLPIFLDVPLCLIVTILCCVDDHFISFVVLLLLTMVCIEFCHFICTVPRKNKLVMHIRSAIDIGFFQ